MTTARRRALDRLRRDSRRSEKQREARAASSSELGEDLGAVEDERLRLLFICCHPALPLDGRVALTLRMVGGLTVPEIARAFLVRESTMGQRISRAKARIRTAGLPYVLPTDEDLPVRLPGVLAVLYLIFNEGYLASSAGDEPVRAELIAEGIRLARLLRALMPQDREVAGLLALMLLAEARRATRVSADGELVTLAEQDRRAWDHAMIDEALLLIGADDPTGGRYLTLARISATHASAAEARCTDWARIVALYDHLTAIDPSPIVALNRAVAVAEVEGPEAGIHALDALGDALTGYHAYFAVRAELERRAGRSHEALAAYERAILLAGNEAERAYLTRRRDESAQGPAPASS